MMDIKRKERNHRNKQDLEPEFQQTTDSIIDDSLTRTSEKSIMTVEEVAQFMQKSVSWIYKNAATLGGRKLGGSLFFPSKEDLYERIFEKRQGMEIRFHTPGNQAYGNLVQDKNRGQTGRSKKKGGTEESETGSGGANRHGLLGSCESEA
jgi:hypothetical protein